MQKRCHWSLANPLLMSYHDNEWGVPEHHDRKLFELMILEGAQAGLSWNTILQKRENYRRAFDRFDPRKVALYKGRDIQRLLADEGIVRNRLKIASAIQNARRFLKIQKEFGSFDRYVWRSVGGKPLRSRHRTLREVPCWSKESDVLSADLKARGFNFVGTKICYSFMQAAGLVNDHLTGCFRYRPGKKI